MTEAEKRKPQEIAAAIKETVRTLNEHFQEAAYAGLEVDVQTMRTHDISKRPDRVVLLVGVSLKL